MKMINLGAGKTAVYFPEWVNVDYIKTPGIDVVHNLNEYPWPFKDSTADAIQAIDVIEHLPSHIDGKPTVMMFIEECHRILKNKGLLTIQTPHWQSKNLWIDPTHVRGFDEKSFDYFDPTTDIGKDYGYYTQAKFRVNSKRSENDNLTFTMVAIK
jgi:predicted SAM-dependent methyltransferase